MDKPEQPLTGNRIVDEISQISFDGNLNVIPASWFINVIRETKVSGKNVETRMEQRADLPAIIILSEIVYWYRPKEIYDKITKEVIGYCTRFTGEKFQSSFNKLAKQFGISKEQARDAVHRLKELGLITIQIKTTKDSKGQLWLNTLHLEPIPNKIKDITYAIERMSTVRSICTKRSISTERSIDHTVDVHRTVERGINRTVDTSLKISNSEIKEEIHVELSLDGSLGSASPVKNPSEEEQSKPKRKKRSVNWQPMPQYADAVQRIFEVWKTEHSKSNLALLTRERGEKIQDRLMEGYTEETIIHAIKGIKHSPHHMGNNLNRTRYIDLELICRYGKNVENFASMLPLAQKSTPSQSSPSQDEKPMITPAEARAKVASIAAKEKELFSRKGQL